MVCTLSIAVLHVISQNYDVFINENVWVEKNTLSEGIARMKKDGAARQDPWEIFVLLLALKFRFILFLYENCLLFYMSIAF